MHFVCRDDLNVTENEDGTFETGFWKVSSKWAGTGLTIALHQDRQSPSYRQGQVLSVKSCIYNGHSRLIFVVRPSKESLPWTGKGTGEKGYRYELFG